MRLAVLSLLALVAGDASAETCGGEMACPIENGRYYIDMPPDQAESSAIPALIFFHGHRGSGRQVIRNKGLIERFHRAGFAVVAPEGAQRPARNGDLVRGWPGRVGDGGFRDDLAYLREAMADIDQNHKIDWKNSLVSGFSSGGSMAWLVACHMGETFGAFAPIAGTLRHPRKPEGCNPTPVRLLHIHGFADKQVPIEGRGIGNWHQGDVFEAMGLARAKNGCRSQPDEIDLGEDFRCRHWTSCQSERDLKLCLHDGGHGLPKGWSDLVLDWLKRSKSTL